MFSKKIELLFFKVASFAKNRPFSFWGGLLFLVFLPLSWPLWTRRMVEGVDMWTSVIRIIAVLQCWQDGALSARWSPTILFGYGYPILNYYAPLFSYFVAGVAWILKEPIIGLNLSLGIIFFLSGVTMFLFASRTWGKVAGFFSAVFYLYTPFHLLEIYNRGACAEFSSYLFLPLVFWLIHRDLENPSKTSFLLAAISMACLILSHNLIGLIGLILLAGYIFFILFSSKKLSARFFGRTIFLFAISACLSASFWLPVILERNSVNLTALIHNGFEYEKHFLNLKNIFWGWGNFRNPLSKGLELKLAIMIASGVLISIPKFIKRKNQAIAIQMIYWAVAGLFTAYLITSASSWIWDSIPPLAFFQFPWRFLVISNFISSFMAGGLIFLIQKIKIRALVCLLLSLVIMSLFWKGTIPLHGWRDLKITNQKEWLLQQHPADSREYIPKNVKRAFPSIPNPRIEVISGKARISPDKFIPRLKNSFHAYSPSGSFLCFHHYYFPGWEVLVNKKRTKIFSDNPVGLIIFFIPPGNSDVIIQFASTWPRTLGNTLSLLTAITILLLLLHSLLLRFRKKS